MFKPFFKYLKRSQVISKFTMHLKKKKFQYVFNAKLNNACKLKQKSFKYI